MLIHTPSKRYRDLYIARQEDGDLEGVGHANAAVAEDIVLEKMMRTVSMTDSKVASFWIPIRHVDIVDMELS